MPVTRGLGQGNRAIPSADLQLAIGKTARAYTNVQDHEIAPNKIGGPGRQRCKRDLCRPRIVLVPRAPGMYSGSGGGVAVVQSSCIASSVAWICRQKRFGVATDGKNVTPWCNEEVKNAIHAKKVAYKAWLQNKTDSSLHSRYAEA